MPLGAFRLNGLGKYAVPSGPQPNTWTTTTHANMITGLTRYTGLNNFTIAIHGVQNTNKLVLVFGTQNSSRNAHTLYPACYDLGTGVFAVGTGVSVGNSHPTGTPYMECAVSGEGNIGMLATVTLVGADWRAYVRGYTISNWGSISTTSLPTLSLSTAYTKSTGTGGCAVGYLGNNRFGVSQRDAAIGDINIMDVFTHNGASAPTIYKTGSVAGGARSYGRPQAVRAGMSTANFAAFYPMPGNNNNTLIAQFFQGNATNQYQTNNIANLGSTSGNTFAAGIVNDVSGSVITINQMRSGTVENRISIAKWTNANTPTTNPSVTTSASYQTAYGPFQNFIAKETKTGSQIYVPVFVSSSATRFDILNIDTTALSISSQTTGVQSSNPWTGDMYWDSWYNSTFGQYIISWSYNTGTGAVSFNFNKWNP